MLKKKRKISKPIVKRYAADRSLGPNAIHEAKDLIKRGGVVLFPTRCLYGMGADALNPCALDRIYNLKQRSRQKAISVLVASHRAAIALAAETRPAALRLMKHFWPGKLTLIFKAQPFLSRVLTADSGKIGIRMPSHPVAAALTAALDGPLTATSANISGAPGCARIDQLPLSITNGVDLILDGGNLAGGNGSTVVDVSGDMPIVLREGVLPKSAILAALNLN